MDQQHVNQKGGSRISAGPAASSMVNKPIVQHWDEWLTICGGPFLMVAEQIKLMPTASPTAGGRNPRRDASVRRAVCLTTLLANMAMWSLAVIRSTGIAVPLSSARASRYDRKAFTREVLRATVGQLEDLGLLIVTPAVFKQQRTIISPTPRFVGMLVSHHVTVRDIERVPGRETIELWTPRSAFGGKKLIDYKDTSESRVLRAELEEINSHLATADIRYAGTTMHPIGQLARKYRSADQHEPHQFTLHGRLYGHGCFWQNLPKSERKYITVNGESCVDLDFASMFVRLAYCKQGLQPPPGDLYALPGLTHENRAGVKQAMNSLFFRERQATRLSSDAKEHLPDGWTMGRLKTAAAALHPPIAPLFDTNVGFELFRIESDILVGVLLSLGRQQVTALGLHDGILVGRSHTAIAADAMRQVSFEQTGFHLEVSEKKAAIQFD